MANKNIKELWYRMLKENQAKILALAMVEFGLTSSTYIKQEWMRKGEVPEEHCERLTSMMQNILIQQEQKTKSLFNN